MTRLLILVEGESERIFVERTLAPFLVGYGVYVERAIVVWTKRTESGGGYRGGVKTWGKIRKSLLPLTGDSDAWITTLFDFYGFPDDFPDYQEIRGSGSCRTQVIALQQRFAAEVNHPKFIPFLALHEFEAWLFSAPDIVAEHFGKPTLAEQLQNILAEAIEPELINHGVNTHPKARLENLKVDYKETADGAILMGKIGITTIRKACPHFSAWLDTLQQLGTEPIP